MCCCPLPSSSGRSPANGSATRSPPRRRRVISKPNFPNPFDPATRFENIGEQRLTSDHALAHQPSRQGVTPKLATCPRTPRFVRGLLARMSLDLSRREKGLRV